jgi:hypothetical protein
MVITISKRFYQKNKSPKDLSNQISKSYLPEEKKIPIFCFNKKRIFGCTKKKT